MNLSEKYPNEMLPVRVIPLTQGKVAIIDPEDYGLISRYKWCAQCDRLNFYAVSYSHGRHHRMHTLITGYKETDHISGNGLDNRRYNLRNATRSLNQANKRRQRNNTSGHVGISWYKRDSKWDARVKIHGDSYFLGRFVNLNDAIAAYYYGAAQLFGEYAPRCCKAISQ